MSAREIQGQKAIAREMFVHQTAHANADVSASPLRGATICSTKSRRDDTLESTADEFCEAADTLLRPVIRVDAVNLMRVLRQLEVIAKRQAPRIAFKAKGSILLLDLADILAVQAECNYVSLQHRPKPYLVHESLSFTGMALAKSTALAVATKVKSGMITSSPGTIPMAAMATSSAAVPLVTAMPCLAW